jgi:arylsulfatase A-like enzyme
MDLPKTLNRRRFLKSASCALAAHTFGTAQSSQRPNIVLIYADDVGWGDLGCYGASRVKTPNLDKLASRGIRFLDAHSSAATCTPSRYSLLTGEYAFRRKGARVLPGDAPLLIEPGRLTLASMLKEQNYATGVVGKWHLGMGTGSPDWNGEIKPGPRELGFDYSFLIPATGDRVPCVYVENGRVVNLDPKDPIRVSFTEPVGDEPTGRANPDKLTMRPSNGHDFTIVNGISRIGYMSGGKSARWVDEDMADTITKKAVQFIDQHKSGPFFLYFASHDIHVPRVPHRRFVGATPMGPRGDVIAELDWCVGEILTALERNKLSSDTLVLFSSDNGPVVDDGYHDAAVEKLGEHRPAGPYRGGKYSSFEAGTRVPFLLRWPAKVKPGVSSALVSQVDLLASFASLTGYKLPEPAGPDSFNLLPVLLGERKTGRDHLVQQASTLSLRQGDWKYIEPGKGQKINKNVNIETGIDQNPQLYNITADPGETRNLASGQAERVARMAALLTTIRDTPTRRMRVGNL